MIQFHEHQDEPSLGGIGLNIEYRLSVAETPKAARRLRLVLLAMLLTLVLAGCSGRRLSATSWPGMLVDRGAAYITFNQEVFAIDPVAQRVEWQYPAEIDSSGPTFYATPATTDGLLVLGGYDNILYGIDRETLRVQWNFSRSTGRYVGSPVVFGERVYAVTAGNELFALSLAELERLGAVEKADESRREAEKAAVIWGPFVAEHGIWASPLVTTDTVYVGSLDHHVYALNAENGNLRWKTELPGAVASTPVLSEDGSTLFVGNFDFNLYALEVDTGKIRWQVEAEGWVWGPPIFVEEKLFFGDLGGYLYAVNPGTGEVLWQEQIADAIRSSPVYDPESGILYAAGRKVANPGNISTRGIVVALEAESYRTLWSQNTAETVYTSPALVDGMVLVAPAQGEVLVQVYNAETGVLQWEFVPHPSS